MHLIRLSIEKKLPRVLCIDEIRFTTDFEGKYICILYDFETKSIVDIIKNRQLPYLNEYFSNIPEAERKEVQYFISDMYDGYRTIKNRFFPKAMHIVDWFHVVGQLTNAVNITRTRVMNKTAEFKSKEYNFMKAHWKLFLCRNNHVPDKFYTYKKTGKEYHYDQMILTCLHLDDSLFTGYNTLQDLYRYEYKKSFEEAKGFIIYLSERLIASNREEFKAVGKTYKKWSVEIANATTANKLGVHLSNAVAEGTNNHIRTIIKSAYGYRNYDRFRRRALLILQKKK